MKTPNTITIDRLAELLSEQTGSPVDVCLRFIKEYFDVITDGIAAGSPVTAKNLGSFAASSHDVTFTPDNSFADIVNAPFAAFPPIPLLDDENPELPSDAEATEQPSTATVIPAEEQEDAAIDMEAEDVVPEQPSIIIDNTPNTETEISDTEISEAEDEETAPIQIEEVDDEAQSASSEEVASAITDDSTDEPDNEKNDESADYPVPYAEKRIQARKRPSRCKMYVMMGIMLIVGLFLGLSLGYLWYHKINAFFSAPIGSVEDNIAIAVVDTIETPVNTKPAIEIVSQQDSITTDTATVAVATAPEAEPAKKIEQTVKAADNTRQPRYDSVDKRTYLATLARRYYGCGDYWVYIYEANKTTQKLRHPDRIAPGTKLRIPYKDELPLTGNDSADIRAARRLGTSIYARF